MDHKAQVTVFHEVVERNPDETVGARYNQEDFVFDLGKRYHLRFQPDLRPGNPRAWDEGFTGLCTQVRISTSDARIHVFIMSPMGMEVGFWVGDIESVINLTDDPADDAEIISVWRLKHGR